MARQNHPFPFSGKLGKLSFFEHSIDGHMVRERKGPSKKRIMNDPKFSNTRKTMSEFGKAGKAVKLVRDSINDQVKDVADARVTYRFNSALIAVLQSDPVNDIGLRKVSAGVLSLLKGFEFNIHNSLKQCISIDLPSTIDRATGMLTVNLPAFVPDEKIKAPQNATHYEITTIGAAYDFDLEKSVQVVNSTGKQLLDGNPTQAQALQHQLPAASTDALFIFLGVSFYKGALNGNLEKLNSGAFNALAIINIDQA